jgi:hypothetical protein
VLFVVRRVFALVQLPYSPISFLPPSKTECFLQIRPPDKSVGYRSIVSEYEFLILTAVRFATVLISTFYLMVLFLMKNDERMKL